MRVSFCDRCRAKSGCSAMKACICAPATTTQVLGSSVFTDAEREPPSSDSSPTYAPGPCSDSTTSRPSGELA